MLNYATLLQNLKFIYLYQEKEKSKSIKDLKKKTKQSKTKLNGEVDTYCVVDEW
jgi:hypothetical protein